LRAFEEEWDMGDSMWQAVASQPYRGHDHFWQRAYSRRQFLGTSAGAAAAMATTPMWFPVLADASGRDPVPIPGSFAPDSGYHAFLGPSVEPSSIFNYRGVTGVAAVQGTGTGWNTEADESMPLLFDSDNRFMRGQYIGMDGREHEGTFGFI
jgi:hypothetical protein